MGRMPIVVAMGAGLVLGMMAAAASPAAPGANGAAGAAALTPEERAARFEEAKTARLQQAIEAVEKQLGSIREYETKAGADVATVLSKAGVGGGGKKAKGGGKFDQAFVKDEYTPELREARSTALACIQKLASIEGRYASCAGSVNSLQGTAARLKDEGPKAALQQLEDSIWQGRRANLEKIAGLYTAIGDYRSAAAVYARIAQAMPKEKRDEAGLAALKQSVEELEKRYTKLVEDRQKYKQEEMRKHMGDNDRYRSNKDYSKKVGKSFSTQGGKRCPITGLPIGG